jgi:pSer/pThr/pTyr-binding forkhead associated (FHA) protein
MGKLVVSLDGVVIKEVQLTKDKTTLGRRPYNDIVIDNLAVSGEHAVLQMLGVDVFIEDLNSTNGTYINGKAIKKQLLVHSDTVEIGKYKIKFLVADGTDYEATQVVRHGSAAPAPVQPGLQRASGFGSLAMGNPSTNANTSSNTSPNPYATSATAPTDFGGLPNQAVSGSGNGAASIKVLNGAAAGREVGLTKVVTTIGKPGVQVASITKRPAGYVFAHVEGAARPTINGNPLMTETTQLKDGDVIELAGTQMQFIHR